MTKMNFLSKSHDIDNNGLNVDQVLSCITHLLEIDPDQLGKSQSIRLITDYVSQLMGCESVQVLEVIRSDASTTEFLKYYPERRQPEKFTASIGINRYCVLCYRFFLAQKVDHQKRIATGLSGAVSDVMDVKQESIPYILTIPDKDEESVLFYPLIKAGECIGTIKLCDFSNQHKFKIDDVYFFRPVADVIANLLHLYNIIEDLDKKNQEYDTLFAETSEALNKLQIGERLTYQFLAATSHLHELAGLLGGMASDRQEFLSVIHFSNLPYKEKETVIEVLDRYNQHRTDAYKKVRELLRDRPAEEKLFIKPHNIKDLINEQLDVYEKQLQVENIRLKKTLKKADVYALVDASAFKYVVRILFNNAIRALVDGNNHTKILSVHSKLDGKNLQIRIADNGIGIAPKYQKRIFEAFYTTKKDGSGIGLWWAKKTIEEEHKGKLILERSFPGNGATFLLTLSIENERN